MSDRRARVAAAIIAGGKATRLGGQDKGGLLIEGRSIADRQLEALLPRFSRVLVVTGAPQPWSGRDVVIIDDRAPPGSGPLAGIDAALAALSPCEDSVLCVGCDMPFISGAALDLLADVAPAADAVVPRIAGRAEPLFARYGRGCLAAIEAALAARRLKTASVLEHVAVHWLSEERLRVVDPQLSSFENVNTPADLQRVRQGTRPR